MTSTVDERALSEQLDAIFSSAVKEAEAKIEAQAADEGSWHTVSAERRAEIRDQAMRHSLQRAVNEARLVVGEAVFRKSKLQLGMANEFHLVMGKEVSSHPLMVAFMQKVADVLPPVSAATAEARAKAKRARLWVKNRAGDNAHDNSNAQPGKVTLWVLRFFAALMMILTAGLLALLLHGIFTGEVSEISRHPKKMISRDLHPIMFWIAVCYHAFIAFVFAVLTGNLFRSAGWLRRLEKVEKVLDTINRVASVFPTYSSKVPPWVAALVLGGLFISLWAVSKKWYF